jgi:hypothetical protein
VEVDSRILTERNVSVNSADFDRACGYWNLCLCLYDQTQLTERYRGEKSALPGNRHDRAEVDSEDSWYWVASYEE